MHYRETIVWQKSMQCAREIYRLAPMLPREEVYGMRAQLTRAIVSIPSNVAEGWARESRREKAQFLAIAHGSLTESETLLTLCMQVGWFPESETKLLRGFLDEVSRMLMAMRRQQRARAMKR